MVAVSLKKKKKTEKGGHSRGGGEGGGGGEARAVGGNHVINAFCFFQAEDGIRDKLVTGVQTCALPI